MPLWFFLRELLSFFSWVPWTEPPERNRAEILGGGGPQHNANKRVKSQIHKEKCSGIWNMYSSHFIFVKHSYLISKHASRFSFVIFFLCLRFIMQHWDFVCIAKFVIVFLVSIFTPVVFRARINIFTQSKQYFFSTSLLVFFSWNGDVSRRSWTKVSDGAFFFLIKREAGIEPELLLFSESSV